MTLTITTDESRKQPAITLAIQSMLGAGYNIDNLYSGDYASLDTAITMGIERKAFNDFIACVGNHSLDDQLSRLKNTYDKAYLLIEGIPDPTPDGWITLYGTGKRYRYNWLTSYLYGWELRGVSNIRVRSIKSTALEIVTAYKVHAKEEHRDTFIANDLLPNMRQATLTERVMAQFPGVGEKRVKEFKGKGLADLANKPVEWWIGILGKGIGRKVWELWR